MGKILKAMIFKLSLYRPITKREFIDRMYEVALLIKYVKEVEAINRSDIMDMAAKMSKAGVLKTPKKYPHKDDKIGLEYQ